MYVSAGGPYPNGFGSFYDAAGYEERARIRRSSNGVCLTALAGILLMGVALPIAGMWFLRSVGFGFTGNSSFEGLPPVLYYLLLGFNYVAGLAIPAFLYFSARRVPLSKGIPFGKVSAADLVLYVAFGCMICMLSKYPPELVAKLQELFGFSGSLPEMPLNNDPAVVVH